LAICYGGFWLGSGLVFGAGFWFKKQGAKRFSLLSLFEEVNNNFKFKLKKEILIHFS